MQVNNPTAEKPWKLEDIIGGISNKNRPITCNPKHENIAYLINIPLYLTCFHDGQLISVTSFMNSIS